MSHIRLASMTVGLLACVAAADPLIETEPNDSPATADFIDESFYPFGAVAIDGTITFEDADYFSFDLTAGDIITVSVFSMTMHGDPMITILAPDESVYASNNDAFGLNPFWGGAVDETGTWYVAVSAGDSDHASEFDYKMAFATNPIPEPATLSILALGAFAACFRRSR